MKTKAASPMEMKKIVDMVCRYFQARLQKETLSILNETVRTLRIALQTILTDHYLALPLSKAREFRYALADQLSNVCEEVRSRHNCSHHDENHHRYCVKEILSCFEWAEQIKAEIPDDIITQRVLALDIPILRPFDYGIGKGQPIKKK